VTNCRNCNGLTLAAALPLCRDSLTMSAHRGRADIPPQGRDFRFWTRTGSGACIAEVETVLRGVGEQIFVFYRDIAELLGDFGQCCR
jgi:hypothetical protein